MTALLDLDCHHLTTLEDICKRSIYGYDEFYFMVCFKFRRSLTHLSLSSLDQTYLIDGRSGNCLLFLPSFEKLTELSVNMQLEDMSLFHFLELCPGLIKIPFEDIHSTIFKQIIEDSGNVVAAAAGRFNNYGRRLKFLNLCLPMLKEPYSSYLERYLINYLETLHINLHDTDFYSWMADYSIESLKTLGKSMSSVKNLVISTRQNSRYIGTRIVQTRLTTSEMKMTRFFLLVGAIKGNRILYCDAMYKQSRSPKVLIKVEDNMFMSLEHTIGNDDYSVDEPFEHTFDSYLPLPDSKISPIGPEIINSLSIIHLHNPTPPPLDILQYAFSNCPCLEKLKVCFSGYDYFETFWLLTTDTYENIRRKKGDISQKLAHQDLTNIKLNGIKLSKDLKEFLAASLPNINTLSCQVDCEYNYFDGRGGSLQRIVELILDLTMFKNLKKFSTQLDMLHDKKYSSEADHYIFVIFNYPGIKKASDCYRIIERNLAYKYQRVMIGDIEDFTTTEKKSDDSFPVIVSFILSRAIDNFTICHGGAKKLYLFVMVN